jgi:DNA-binding CsgD family transcriptional regulator/RecA/RadA recombinase
MAHGIVGREAELKAVDRFLAAVGKRPAALVIEGEAGIGKTTVWQQAVAAAQARGFRVLQARPAESEAMLSYAALADLIGAAFDETRAELPQPQQRAVDAALLRADADGHADPRTTATALVAVLTALAAERPTVVAIDDVQWLDRASERALEFAARRLPARLGLLLTRRSDGDDDGGAPLALDRALPEEQLDTVVPRPLSLAALHHLLQSRRGTAPARPTLVRIAAASGGNPFFALEIASALEREAGERGLGDPLPVTPGLHELVAARVRTLSREGREAVLVVSALSRPTVATVAAALGAGHDSLAGLIEAAEEGVLVSERERLRFSHPLLASAVYGSASRQRRRQLHRRLADVATDPEERARHLARSTTQADVDIAAELERVAERAVQRGAQDAAAELFEASSRLTPPDRPDDLARRLLGEGSALFAAGDVARARSLADRVVATSPHGRARVDGLVLLARIASIDGTAEATTEYLERALTDAGDDSALRGALHAMLAAPHMRPDGVARHADAAIRLLDAEEQPGLVAQVLIQKFVSEAMLGKGARRSLLKRGLDLEAKAGPAAGRSILPLTWYRAMDEFDAARARYRLDEQWCRERGEEGWRAQRLAYVAEVELRAGNWAVAERYIEESCGVLEQVATRGPWSAPLRIRAYIDAHRGRLERARTTLLALVDEAERTNDLFWAVPGLSTLAFVELTAGDSRAVDRALTRMAEHIADFGVQDHIGDRSQPDHIEALVGLGETARARGLLEHLERRGRTMTRLWIDTTLPRARALVLAAEGDVPAAVARLETTPEREELPFELARTLLVQGMLLRRLKQKRAAADVLRRALELFQRLGSPPWVERASRELDRVGLRHAARWELTETERRVAELAAAGRTNREVAQQLFMSPKTVEAHLARVYRKLAIGSRAELGARMAERA